MPLSASAAEELVARQLPPVNSAFRSNNNLIPSPANARRTSTIAANITFNIVSILNGFYVYNKSGAWMLAEPLHLFLKNGRNYRGGRNHREGYFSALVKSLQLGIAQAEG
ncbi:MAG: hypothetical protein WD577_13585 [Bacteroidales bacterium]